MDNLTVTVFVGLAAWTVGCVLEGVGLTLLAQRYKTQKLFNRILDIEDFIMEDKNKEKIAMELDMLKEKIEYLQLMRDDGMISEYDYNVDMKMYERRLDTLEKELEQEESNGI